MVGALRVAWEATDRLCSKRLHPFLSELIRILRRHGEVVVPAELEAEICQMSPATIYEFFTLESVDPEGILTCNIRSHIL